MVHIAADFGLTFDDAARHYAVPIAVGAPGVATLGEER